MRFGWNDTNPETRRTTRFELQRSILEQSTVRLHQWLSDRSLDAVLPCKQSSVLLGLTLAR